MKWVDVNVGGELRGYSRRFDDFIMKRIEVGDGWLVWSDNKFSLYNKEVFVYWVRTLIWVLALFLC